MGDMKSVLIISLFHKQNKKKNPSLEMTYALKYNEIKTPTSIRDTIMIFSQVHMRMMLICLILTKFLLLNSTSPCPNYLGSTPWIHVL